MASEISDGEETSINPVQLGISRPYVTSAKKDTIPRERRSSDDTKEEVRVART